MPAHVTKGNVFDDLGLNYSEAQNLKIRAVLMNALVNYIQENEFTQKQAAATLEITQPRVSNLFNGKINLFSIDQLVLLLTKVNIPVALVIDDRLAA